jgi:ribose transport system permease protein
MTEHVVPQASGAVASRRMTSAARWRRAYKLLQTQIVFILLIGLVLAASLLSNVFMTTDNLVNIVRAVSVLGIVALGQTVLLITGNFDMSVAMVVPFAGMLAIGVQRAGGDLWLSLAAAMIGGLVVGFVNGTLVVRTKANPFLITLGTQTLVYAGSLIITQAKTWYGTIPAYNVIGRGNLAVGASGFNIPYSVLLFLGLAIALEWVLRRTIWGKYLFSLGYNEEATILSGVNTSRIKLAAFVFCGACASIAGIVMSSRLNSTNASGAVGMDFESLIASVLGGTSLFGGSGSALRTVAGVLVLGVLNNLLVLMAVPYEAQLAVKGAVFLAVVWIDGMARRSPS